MCILSSIQALFHEFQSLKVKFYYMKKNMWCGIFGKFSSVVVLLMMLSSMSVAIAATSIEESISNKLKAINSNIEVESLIESPWPGMYEITLKTGEVIFSDQNAEYLMIGQMYNLSQDEGFINLTERKFQAKVAKTLAKVPAAEQIVYAAIGEEKAAITVFTDIDCYYCQKLHKAVPQLQKNGVTVKYMAFPRAGVGSDVARQMESIWCAKDPSLALTAAKSKQRVASIKCDNPVSRQFRLGHELGVNATPSIFTEAGVKIAGFASTKSLLNELGLL